MLGSCLETAGRRAVGPAPRASEASALTLARCTGQDILCVAGHRSGLIGLLGWPPQLIATGECEWGGSVNACAGPVLIALRYADMYSTRWRTKRAVGVGGAQGGGKSESPEVVNNKHAGRAGEGEEEGEGEGERGREGGEPYRDLYAEGWERGKCNH
jgi:hypothetical protein